jgi:hypothetical protein
VAGAGRAGERRCGAVVVALLAAVCFHTKGPGQVLTDLCGQRDGHSGAEGQDKETRKAGELLVWDQLSSIKAPYCMLHCSL